MRGNIIDLKNLIIQKYNANSLCSWNAKIVVIADKVSFSKCQTNNKLLLGKKNPGTWNVSTTQDKDTSNLGFCRYLLSKARASLGGFKKVSATQRKKDTSTLICRNLLRKQRNHHVVYTCICTFIWKKR